jgi:hypothetical protein
MFNQNWVKLIGAQHNYQDPNGNVLMSSFFFCNSTTTSTYLCLLPLFCLISSSLSLLLDKHITLPYFPINTYQALHANYHCLLMFDQSILLHSNNCNMKVARVII